MNAPIIFKNFKKTTMEELYAAENPESLGLVPESVIRRQEVSLVEDIEGWEAASSLRANTLSPPFPMYPGKKCEFQSTDPSNHHRI